MTFGERMKHCREEKGLSQRELGTILGVKQQTIAQYEKLTDAPKAATVNKIAKALGIHERKLTGKISMVELFAGTKDLDFSKNSLNILNEAVTNLPQIAQDSIEQGKQIVNNAIDISCKNNIMDYYEMLNIEGRKKAAEQIELLTKIPEYQNVTPDNDND